MCLDESEGLQYTWSCSIVSNCCGTDPVSLVPVGQSSVCFVRTGNSGVGPLHDRQICCKVHASLVQCPLLKSLHIGAQDTLRLHGLGCCKLSLKGKRGQFTGKWFLAPQS